MLLAGDIGGTKVNLAIYSPEGGPKDPLHEKTFSSAKYSNLESVVEDFLKQTGQSCSRSGNRRLCGYNQPRLGNQRSTY